ncbi:hypothetical protein, partial [Bacteroides thetaiotaomicron]|uniref:hypothetical protein n=1 Tax=Bacteroides thetaiotaomicron TaxID=818 RepID=UPI003260A0CA
VYGPYYNGADNTINSFKVVAKTAAASLNGVLRRSDSEEILQGSENGCVLILKKVYGVALVGTGGPAPCRWALPDR